MTQASDFDAVSHDVSTRLLHSVKLTPDILWEHVEGFVKKFVKKEGSVLVVDDSVIAKQYPDLMSYRFFHTTIQEQITR